MGATTEINTMGVISMVLFISCFIPQIIRILQTKNVSGISIRYWVILVTGYVTGMLYVIPLKAPILITTYSIGLVLACYTLYLVIKYSADG